LFKLKPKRQRKRKETQHQLPVLLESQTENENIGLMFLGRPVSNAANKFGRSALVHEIMEDLYIIGAFVLKLGRVGRAGTEQLTSHCPLWLRTNVKVECGSGERGHNLKLTCQNVCVVSVIMIVNI
jgi:hypothetical protein